MPSKSGIQLISLEDIIRLEAEGSYTRIFCTDKKQILVSRHLKGFELSLAEESFFRTHKSHLVNFRHIKQYFSTKYGGYIEVSDGSTVEVSRPHKKELAEILNNFILQ